MALADTVHSPADNCHRLLAVPFVVAYPFDYNDYTEHVVVVVAEGYNTDWERLMILSLSLECLGSRSLGDMMVGMSFGMARGHDYRNFGFLGTLGLGIDRGNMFAGIEDNLGKEGEALSLKGSDCPGYSLGLGC